MHRSQFCPVCQSLVFSFVLSDLFSSLSVSSKNISAIYSNWKQTITKGINTMRKTRKDKDIHECMRKVNIDYTFLK